LVIAVIHPMEEVEYGVMPVSIHRITGWQVDIQLEGLIHAPGDQLHLLHFSLLALAGGSG